MNPEIYLVAHKSEFPSEDSIEFGSNFEWILGRAKNRAETLSETQIIYKLVPVMEVTLEVTTKIITKDLLPPPIQSSSNGDTSQ